MQNGKPTTFETFAYYMGIMGWILISPLIIIASPMYPIMWLFFKIVEGAERYRLKKGKTK